jgi:anti-anti-sigma factor
VHVPVDDYYRVTFEELDGEAVVMVTGEIDLTAQSRLQGVIDHARSGGQRLVIDLSEITFIDSSGLKVLVKTWEAQTEAGAEMVLRAPSPAVRTVIEMTGLQDVLPVERPGTPAGDDQGEAAQARLGL